MSNSDNLSQRASTMLAYLDKNPTDRGKGRGPGHDVSNEPRVPKGNPSGGQWTSANGPSTPVEKTTFVRGTTVTIIHADGTTEIRNGGSRPWRLNNPGSIQAGDFANRHGAIGSDGFLAVFPDAATGEAAQEALLRGPSYSSLTVNEAVEKRTPKSDPSNDTERTKKLVRDFSGLPGDAVIGRLAPADKQRLYSAIRRSEGWGKTGSVTFTGRE
jgi:hypothetical protein